MSVSLGVANTVNASLEIEVVDPSKPRIFGLE